MVTIGNWIECKIQYEVISTEDGKQKKVTDTYLVDALNFTEAEARIIEHVRPYMSGEFSVSSVRKTRLFEIFESATGDIWYRAKILFVVLDPEKGKEKRVASSMLVQGENIADALLKIGDAMKETMSDYEVASIAETSILDVLPFKQSES